MRTLATIIVFGFLLLVTGCTESETTDTPPAPKPAKAPKPEKEPPPSKDPFAKNPAKRPPMSPYPGGSPFPPGGEPSLTHVVEVFWTTLEGTVTEIQVECKGSRPSQVELHRGMGDTQKSVSAFIAPESSHAVRIVPAASKDGRYSLDGSGILEVRVYGFALQDYDRPPTVAVRYVRGGEELPFDKVGAPPQTQAFTVVRQPVSKKLKKK